MKEQLFDPRRKIFICNNESVMVDFAVNHFIACAKHAIKKYGSFFVALSGGSTPKLIYRKLSSDYRNAIDWKKVVLFWSDERSVGIDHPDSNYKMAIDSGLGNLSIPSHQIFRMEGEKNALHGAEEYEKLLYQKLGKRPFDLIMLGMGEDGHTASLFPDTTALGEKDRRVVANWVEKLQTWRITFTIPWINQAENTVLYVIGTKKKERLYDVLYDKSDSYPASKIGTLMHPALWIVDKEASELLLKEDPIRKAS